MLSYILCFLGLASAARSPLSVGDLDAINMATEAGECSRFKLHSPRIPAKSLIDIPDDQVVSFAFGMSASDVQKALRYAASVRPFLVG